MKVFHAGMPGWKKAGGLVLTSPAALESWNAAGDSFVLVDLREPAAARSGFLPGAVNVPARQLAASEARFPKEKKAPVVLYDSGQASAEAFATVRGWGFVNASVLAGGRSAWTGAVSARPAAKIVYAKRLKPGEISIDEFKRIAQARPRGTVLLDVREEPVDGALPGALAIPESELDERAAEVPKDRDVVIHCNTGILARRAHEQLAAAGHSRTRYLNAVIVIGGDGSYEIAEK